MNGSAIRHSLQCGRTYALRPEGMSLRLTKTFCDFAVKRKKGTETEREHPSVSVLILYSY